MRRSLQARARGERHCSVEEGRLFALAARQMEEVSDRWLLVPIENVTYLFLGSAVLQGLVHGRWTRGLRFRSPSVYIRSDRGAIFQTAYRSLAELLRHLGRRFVPGHRSLAVNLHKITAVDLTGRVPLLEIAGSGWSDLVSVSRRLLPQLRARLGFPKRRARKHRNLRPHNRS